MNAWTWALLIIVAGLTLTEMTRFVTHYRNCECKNNDKDEE